MNNGVFEGKAGNCWKYFREIGFGEKRKETEFVRAINSVRKEWYFM